MLKTLIVSAMGLCLQGCMFGEKPQLFSVVAPIDGRLVSVADTGTQLDPAISESEQIYAFLREHSSTEKNLPEFNAELFPESVLFSVRSDLLEIQIETERAKLALAEKQLALAVEARELEVQLRSNETALHAARATKIREHSLEFRKRNRHSKRGCDLPNNACTGWSSTSRETAASNTEATETQRIFSDRKEFQIAKAIPTELEVAQGQIDAARYSLKLLEATAALGRVNCVTECTVRRLLAVPGQYVTKGDAIAEVQYIRKGS